MFCTKKFLRFKPKKRTSQHPVLHEQVFELPVKEPTEEPTEEPTVQPIKDPIQKQLDEIKRQSKLWLSGINLSVPPRERLPPDPQFHIYFFQPHPALLQQMVNLLKSLGITADIFVIDDE